MLSTQTFSKVSLSKLNTHVGATENYRINRQIPICKSQSSQVTSFTNDQPIHLRSSNKNQKIQANFHQQGNVMNIKKFIEKDIFVNLQKTYEQKMLKPTSQKFGSNIFGKKNYTDAAATQPQKSLPLQDKSKGPWMNSKSYPKVSSMRLLRKSNKFQLNALPKIHEGHQLYERRFGEFDIVNLQSDKVFKEPLNSSKSNYMDTEFQESLQQLYDRFRKVDEVFKTGDFLNNLERRPRCQDDSLNLRFSVNKSFSKDEIVTDYYDPKDPTINIRPELIKMYQLQLVRQRDLVTLKVESKTAQDDIAKNGAEAAQFLKAYVAESNESNKAETESVRGQMDKMYWRPELQEWGIRSLPSSHWRPELLKMLSFEPNLKKFDGSHLSEGENVVFVTIDNLNFHRKGQNMNKEDMDLVHRAMRMDLTKVIDWNKSTQLQNIYPPQPAPYHYRAFDNQYWKEISSEICFMEEPIQVSLTKGTYAFRFTHGYNAYSNEQNPMQMIDKTPIEINQLIVRKLSLIAHNFYELKQIDNYHIEPTYLDQQREAYVIMQDNQPKKHGKYFDDFKFITSSFSRGDLRDLEYQKKDLKRRAVSAQTKSATDKINKFKYQASLNRRKENSFTTEY